MGRPAHVARFVVAVVVGPAIESHAIGPGTEVHLNPGCKVPEVTPGFVHSDSASAVMPVCPVTRTLTSFHDALPGSQERVPGHAVSAALEVLSPGTSARPGLAAHQVIDEYDLFLTALTSDSNGSLA